MRVELWSDGSGTQGAPGGWAYVLRAISPEGELLKQEEARGGATITTNNRMEMTAILKGLQALRRRTKLTVISDSKIATGPWREKWIEDWRRKQFRKKIKNLDLVLAIDHEVSKHDITWEIVKGHTKIELNDRCDRLAGQTRLEIAHALLDGGVKALSFEVEVGEVIPARYVPAQMVLPGGDDVGAAYKTRSWE